jgi:hypothetical protein
MLWRIFCWPCIVVGSGMFLVSFASYAQTAGAQPIDAATYWRDVATGSIGLCLIMIGWYMRSTDSRLRATSEALLRNYHTKEETREMVEDVLKPVEQQADRIEREVRAVHRRLDTLKVPHASSE